MKAFPKLPLALVAPQQHQPEMTHHTGLIVAAGVSALLWAGILLLVF